MANLNWVLVNRQYQLTTGWMVFPPTAAMFWKLEMTNLVAEMLTNPFPVTSDVLTFGTNAIAPITPATGYQGALPPGRPPRPLWRPEKPSLVSRQWSSPWLRALTPPRRLW